MKEITKIILIMLSVVMAKGHATTKLEVRKKPNIILVFIDDMGWADFSCFGNTDAATPNVDRLAQEGIAFEQFYVNSPICSPSRVAISTGTYPQRWKISSFLSFKKNNKERGMANWLDPKAPMLARTLKDAGYATGHFGKWHMGGQRDVSEAPEITEYGFDKSLTNFEGIGEKLLPLTINKDGKPGRIWTKEEHTLGEPVTWMERWKITGGFIDSAIPFMDKAKSDGKPFYINVWPDDVHGPFFPSYERLLKIKSKLSADENKIKDRPWRKTHKREVYLAVLEEMDKQFAKLFDYVRNDSKLRDNTLILICSDNGPEPNAGRAGELKGHKTQLYEGGIRSSLIAWGPGVLDKNTAGLRNKKSLFTAMDLVPTLIDIVGADSHTDYDGESLPGVLLGRTMESRQAPVFYRRPPGRNSYYGVDNLPDLAMREGKWKLMCEIDGSLPELYDIEKDPSESNDLASKYPKRVREMAKQVKSWSLSMPQDKVCLK